MATLATGNPTLLDVAKRMDPEGKIDSIVELLNETNDILQDATWIEGNLPTGHRTTIRSGLPSGTWRKLNYGVQPAKSRTVQVTDACGILEARSVVDIELARLNGNTADFRLSEDRAFIAGLNIDMADVLFLGDTDTAPEKFMGLGPRYDDDTNAENKDNIIKGDGAGSDNTSIWLVVWSPNTVHMIYPKGSKGGLEMEDMGVQVVTDDQSPAGRFNAYETVYRWKAGLCLRDWRYVVRICNIDVSNLTKDAATGTDLVDLMTQAVELVPSLSIGRAAFYCNRTVRSYLRRQIKNAKNMNLSLETVAGKRVVAFDGIPVRRCDAILETEATIS